MGECTGHPPPPGPPQRPPPPRADGGQRAKHAKPNHGVAVPAHSSPPLHWRVGVAAKNMRRVLWTERCQRTTETQHREGPGGGMGCPNTTHNHPHDARIMWRSVSLGGGGGVRQPSSEDQPLVKPPPALRTPLVSGVCHESPPHPLLLPSVLVLGGATPPPPPRHKCPHAQRGVPHPSETNTTSILPTGRRSRSIAPIRPDPRRHVLFPSSQAAVRWHRLAAKSHGLDMKCGGLRPNRRR